MGWDDDGEGSFSVIKVSDSESRLGPPVASLVSRREPDARAVAQNITPASDLGNRDIQSSAGFLDLGLWGSREWWQSNVRMRGLFSEEDAHIVAIIILHPSTYPGLVSQDSAWTQNSLWRLV